MMEERIRQIIRGAIITLIEDTASAKNVQKSQLLHQSKVHFIPVKYRILGGLIQSLNIKFGNFIERLLALIIASDDFAEALPESGKKLTLRMTPETDTLIDQYITKRQLPDSGDDCTSEFHDLLQQIVQIEMGSGNKQSLRKDIDALFRTRDGQIIYLEVKYNDDHDTGKFVDINRKFLKTFAGIINHLDEQEIVHVKPIIYYFNPTKRWGPIYVPSTHIYRGSQLFDEYFQTSYTDVDRYLRSISDDEEVMSIFDELYRRVRYEL